MSKNIPTEKISNIQVLSHIWKHGTLETRKRWKYLIPLFLVYIICTVSEPFIYQKIIDITLTNTNNFLEVFYSTIIYYIGFWGLITVGGIIAFALFQKTIWKYLNIDSGILAIYLVRKFLVLPIDTHSTIGGNEIQKTFDRTANGQWEIANAIGNRLSIPVTMLICMVILGFYTNVTMTLFCLLPLPLGTWWLAKTGDRLSREQSESNNNWDATLHRIADALVNIRIIKIFARNNHEISIVKEKYDIAIDKQLKINIGWAITESASEGFQLVVKILIFSIGIYRVGIGALTIGELILFLVIVGRIYGPIMSILYTYRDTIKNIANYKKGLALLDIHSETDNGKKILKKIESNISFKSLSFSYPSSPREVLTDINFEIKKGQRIALIGHTGSGKSTITQLLMRFYEPSSGSIEIDGDNIYEFTLDSYRQKFAAVFQDTTLFNETIRHNLEYVRDGITEKELKKACKEANILDFIESLPEKWETQVGERGLKLSGGEKQRIAIARAILADPEVLILDEATSALDTKTERLVQEAFDHLMDGRTSIIIAHRLSTIVSADVIYLMDKGRIVASGNHSELYKSSTEYKEMVDMQHDGFVGEEVENS